jgi:hypothetical protein
MGRPLTYQQRLARKLPRVVKFSRQWLRTLGKGRSPARLVFILGAQRSGTRLPLQIIDQSPEIATYSEGSAPYFDDVLLQPLDQVEELVRRSPSPIIALKPICETHRIHELLDRFPSSKAIWIFRSYIDTVNSASAKWGSGLEALKRIARREIDPLDWRVGGLSEERLRFVADLYREDMSLHEANAVLWYTRNVLFFDLKANERRDVLLVRYEDLIDQPRESFDRVFGFIDTPVPPDATAAIRSSERGKRRAPEMSDAITACCEEVHQRLLSHYNAERAVLDRASKL